MAADRTSIVAQINDGLAKNDLDQVLSCCTDDFTWNMVGDRTVSGKEAVREWLTSPDAQGPQFTIDLTLADGDYVVSRGHMMMKDKDGVPEPYAFCDVYHFTGDAVRELETFVIKTDKQKVGA